MFIYKNSGKSWSLKWKPQFCNKVPMSEGTYKCKQQQQQPLSSTEKWPISDDSLINKKQNQCGISSIICSLIFLHETM